MKIGKLFLSIVLLITSSKSYSQNSNSQSSTNILTHPIKQVMPAESSTGAIYKSSVKVSTLGRSVQDQSLKSTLGWSFIEAGVNSKYNDWFSFDLNLLGIFGEGAGQNYLSDEGGSANTIIIDSIAAILTPVQEVTLKAGIIGYKINPIITLVSPGTSLGAEQKIEFSNSSETLKVSAIGNEAIPSVGVTKGIVQQDSDPYFLSGSLQLEGTIKPLKTTIKIATSQFKFANIPKSAAKGALTGGNSPQSISGIGDNQQYVIGFAGTESAASLETEWTSKFKTSLKVGYIINDRAFEDRNKGYIGKFDFKWKMFRNFTLSPSLTLFDVQSDSSPAPYTILINRYNNRKGNKINLDFEFEKQKLVLFVGYAKMNELVSSPYISDREIYNIGVEVSYDLL